MLNGATIEVVAQDRFLRHPRPFIPEEVENEEKVSCH